MRSAIGWLLGAWVGMGCAGGPGDPSVWLGGETEDPAYDGRPTQYCALPRSCSLPIPATGKGGPVRLSVSGCTP